MISKNNTYTSILAHEMRTPLTSIRGYLSMIIEGDMGEISDETRKALNICYDSATRLTKLTNDILALSKIHNGKMEYFKEKINIIQLLQSIFDEMFILCERKGISLEIDADSNLKNTYIYQDRDKLLQVYVNLISNAVKFTDVGGKVLIRATKKGETVLFEIIDNGIGIPKEKQKNIFQKYVQHPDALRNTDNPGLGLGLALSDTYITDFGSKIKLQSEVGTGSNFYFSLPLL